MTEDGSDTIVADNVRICNVNNIPISKIAEGITVAPGCVLLAEKDLTTIVQNSKYLHASVLVICSNKAAGSVRIDHDVLEAYDLIFEGNSLVSSMVLDASSSIKFFQYPQFEGQEKFYTGTLSSGELPKMSSQKTAR